MRLWGWWKSDLVGVKFCLCRFLSSWWLFACHSVNYLQVNLLVLLSFRLTGNDLGIEALELTISLGKFCRPDIDLWPLQAQMQTSLAMWPAILSILLHCNMTLLLDWLHSLFHLVVPLGCWVHTPTTCTLDFDSQVLNLMHEWTFLIIKTFYIHNIFVKDPHNVSEHMS